MTIAKAITKTLDISVEDVRIDLTATIRSYDLTDTQFIFEIKSSSGMTVNLTGSTAIYIVEYVHNSQTYAIQGDIDIIGTDTLSFNLPEDLKGYSGTVLIGIYVKLTDGTKIDIKDIAVRIEPSIMDKDIDFSAKTYFEDFETVKAEVVSEGEKAKTEIKAIVADVQSTGETAKEEIKTTLPSLQNQVSELKEGLVNTNQTLNVLCVKNADITASNATYSNLLFTPTAIFPRINGLIENKKYRIVIKPIDDVNISLKAFKYGSFLKEYELYRNIKGNEIFITDILWEFDSEVALCVVNETPYDLSPMYIGAYDTTDLNNIQISMIDKPVASFQKYNLLTWYKNKKLTALGDSLTEQARYLNFLKDTLYFNTIQNCGEGGTTVAGTSPHAMNNDERINKMDNDSDVILFMGGINDWVQNIQLGNIDDTDVSTFYGALNSIAEKLINKYPTKLIVFMGTTYAIHHGNQFSEDGLKNANGSTTKDYSDCIMNVSKKYGIPFVDLYGNCGWSKFNISSFVTNDGAYLHPNENGGKRMGRIIYSKLVEVMPTDYIS